MTDPAVGVQSILGISGFESSFRAATTVDRFYEFVTEGITRKKDQEALRRALATVALDMRTYIARKKAQSAKRYFITHAA